MRRHRLDPVSLVFGLLFTAVGLVFFAGDVEIWWLDWSWFWPGALLLLGVMVLVSSRSSAEEQRDARDEAEGAPDDYEPPWHAAT